MTKPGDALRAWRKKRDLSQNDAAQKLSPPVTQSAWAAWENGTKPPSLQNALSLQRLTRGKIKAQEWVPKPAPEDAPLHAKAG